MNATGPRRLAGASWVAWASAGGLVCGDLLGTADLERLAALARCAQALQAVAAAGLCWVTARRHARFPRHRSGARLDLLLLIGLMGVGCSHALSRSADQGRQSAAAERLAGTAWVRGCLSTDGTLTVTEIRQLHQQHPQCLRPALKLLVARGDARAGARQVGAVEGFVRIDPARGIRGPGGWDDRPRLRAPGAGGWAQPVLLGWVAAAADAQRPWPGYAAGLARTIAAAFGGRAGALAAGFFLGRRGLATQGTAGADCERILRRAGVGHILAVSGLHIGLFGLLVMTLLRCTPLAPVWRWVLLAVGLLGYGTLVGWGTSVVRAAVAGAVACLIQACGRRCRAADLFPLVLAGTLWSDPSSWRGAGFQLSYLISFALVGVGGGRRGTLAAGRRGRWSRGVRRACACVLAAQAVAWPLQLVHFGHASPLYPLSNLLLLPIAGLIPAVVLPALCLAWIPGFPRDVGLAPAELLLDLVLGLAERFAGQADQHLLARTLPPALGTGCAVLAAGVCCWRRWPLRRRVVLTLGAALGITIAGGGVPPAPAFLMLDVGQGEAWVLFWPRETWVVDLGAVPGTAGRPRRVLGETLRTWGRSRIDRLFLTHDDLDHTGGRSEIHSGAVTVGRIHHPWGWSPGDGLAAWLDSLGRDGAALEPLAAGDTIQTAGGSAVVLHPPRTTIRSQDDNASGLALRLSAGELHLLICGDAPGSVAVGWARGDALTGTQLVSAAHHGSASGTPRALLRAAGARGLLISAGRHNRFGHPAPSLLHTAGAEGLAVFRTDRDGTLLITRGAGGWKVHAWRSGRSLRVTADGCPRPAE